MFPVLLSWKFLTLHTYGLFAALGVLAGHAAATARSRRLDARDTAVSDALPAVLIGALLGARALYVATHPAEFAGAWMEIAMIWRGGLMWHGGLIGGALAGALFFHRRKYPLARAADVFAPGLALGQALGRLGCFFAGCCYGRACDLPWAVTFRHPAALAPLGVPLHPSPLYDAAWNAAVFALLWRLARRDFWTPGRGRLVVLYLTLAALGRWLVELTRGDDRGAAAGPFTVTLLLALAAPALGAVLFLRRKSA